MKSFSMTMSRLAAALPKATAFIFMILLAWLAANFVDAVAFGGAGRAFLAGLSMNGFQAFAVLSIGALMGWGVGWRDGQRRREG